MNYETAWIKEYLEPMNSQQRLGFGLCLLERAIPMFHEFQAETQHMGAGEVTAALATCWCAIEKDQWAPIFINAADCETVMPDSEDYDSFYTSAAMDAVAIGCSLLDFIESRDLKEIMDATQLQMDTIDLADQALVHEYGVDENDALISGDHSQLARELRRMRADISFLSKVSNDAGTFASRLRRHVLDAGYRNVSLIGRPPLWNL